MGLLGSCQSCGLGSFKWSTYALSIRTGFLAIGVPTNSVDHGGLSRLFRLSNPYSFALLIRDTGSPFWRPPSESWEVVSSPLVARSNALAETAARIGEIVAVRDVLSRSDFTCQDGAVGLDIAVELAGAIDTG